MGRRVAFLLGNQTFRDDSGLAPLRGPLNDVEALSELLGDPDRGGFDVRVFRDAASGETKAAIEEELGTAGRGDLVLIAYAGHGKLDRNGRLCLATADTKSAALHATSIPAQQLREMVENSDCDAVVLLLDCCFSGAAANLRGDVQGQLGTLQDASGFYILTASSEIQTAGEGEAVTSGAVMGRFTAALVDGIRTGAADQDRDGEIKLRDLVRHVQETLKHQTPQFLAARAAGDPLISRSPATDTRLPEDVLKGLSSDTALMRIGAAWRLARLARMSDDVPRATRAKQTILKRLHGEDGERDHLVREALKEAVRAAQELPDWRKGQTELPDFGDHVDPFNLTGVWTCNDGGTYFVRNLGPEVWWFGHGVHPHQSFANVAYGQVEGESDTRLLRLKWADIPMGTTNIYGRLTLHLNFAIQFNRVTHMSIAERTGNFGGSLWAWSHKWESDRQIQSTPSGTPD